MTTCNLPSLAAFGHPVHQWPPFMSSVAVELWQVAKGAGPATHAVRVLYNQQPVDLGKALEGSAGQRAQGGRGGHV